MKSKLLILVLFAAVALAILFFGRKGSAPAPAASVAAEPVVSAPPPRPVVELPFLYSTEKKEWIEASVAEFSAAHPEIKVVLSGKGSLEASDGILDGSLKPVLWSPADSLVLKLFAADWLTKNGQAAFGDGDDAPEPLLLTPLVFVAWEDRAKALESFGGGKITWQTIHKAVSSNQGWPTVKGKADWGFVKLGHTDPTRSNSGLQTLVLIALEYFGRSTGAELKVEDILKPDFQKFLRELEAGVTRFENSTGTFMTDMVRFGPSKYDIAVVYESSAISQLSNAQGRWGNLRVYYPKLTLWSDHPIALLNAPWVTDAQRAAARQLSAFLRSKPVQERALRFGFRPAETSVPLKTADPQNPFTRLAEFGVQTSVPSVAEPPDAAVIRNLLALWTRIHQQP
ncbi:MAG TPA: substrate-binding domain-containing protein [Polyangiaceae bacterium]|nr:substrate-binding domain-containing protein [Polyangiaceae bacterium]